MIYFKKIDLLQYSYAQIEHGLRNVSLKRTTSLDMVSSVSNVGSDRYFLGYEKGDILTFTRIRTSLEGVLPRVIIKLTPDNNNYQVRFSLLSTIVFFFFSLLLIIIMLAVIVGNSTIEAIIGITAMVGIYISLVMLEIRLVRLKVSSAIAKCVIKGQV